MDNCIYLIPYEFGRWNKSSGEHVISFLHDVATRFRAAILMSEEPQWSQATNNL